MLLSRKSIVLSTLIVGFGLLLWFLYQLRRAEAGYPNHLPRVARAFLARREYQIAKNSPYKDHQLIGYVQAVKLDPDHFPDAWEYLCNFYVNTQEWGAASAACQRAENLAGPIADNQKALGKIYEHLQEYSRAGDKYATAASLSPSQPTLKENALWMFLASHRYDTAANAARDLIDYQSAGRPQVNKAKAQVALGFAAAQLGNKDEARAAYAVGLPDLRNPSCTLEDHAQKMALICSGRSLKDGHQVSSCIGAGCS